MHMNSSQHPFAQIYSLQKHLHYFGAEAIFLNGTQRRERVERNPSPGELHGAVASVGVTHKPSHPNAVPAELMSARCRTFHRQDVGSFPPARETGFYLLRVHGRSWVNSSINHLSVRKNEDIDKPLSIWLLGLYYVSSHLHGITPSPPRDWQGTG